MTPRSLRRRARRVMPDLLSAQRHRCYFCGRRIVHVSKIPKDKRLAIDATTVTYLRRGQVRRELFATIEHLVPIRAGGRNDRRNLVATCFCCNN